MVTLKVLVQDPNRYFIPTIQRENFAVNDKGVGRITFPFLWVSWHPICTIAGEEFR